MTTKDAFDRLDALMSRQPPGKKIPPPAPVRNPGNEDDGLAAMWDEMWGLWVPTTTGGLIR